MAAMMSASTPSSLADMAMQTMPAMAQDSGLSAVPMPTNLFDMPVSVDMLNLGLSDIMMADPTAAAMATATADLVNTDAFGATNNFDNFNNLDNLNDLNVLSGMENMGNMDAMGNMASLGNINTDNLDVLGNAFGTQTKTPITNDMTDSVSRLTSLNLPIEDIQSFLDESGMDEPSKTWVLERTLHIMSTPITLPGPGPITLSMTPPLSSAMMQSSSSGSNSGPSSSSSSSSSCDQTASPYMSAPFPESAPVSSVQTSGLNMVPGSISMPMFDSASMPTGSLVEPAAGNSESSAPPQQYHHHMPPPVALNLQPQVQPQQQQQQRVASVSGHSPESHPVYSDHSNGGMYASSGPHHTHTQGTQRPTMSQPNQPVYNESPVPQYQQQQHQFQQQQVGDFQPYSVSPAPQQHSGPVYMPQAQVPPQMSQGQRSPPQPVFTRQPTYHHHPPPAQATYPPTAQYAQPPQVLTHHLSPGQPSTCSPLSSAPQHTQPLPLQSLPSQNARLQTAIDKNYTYLPRQTQSGSRSSSRRSKSHRSAGNSTSGSPVSSPSTPASARDSQIDRKSVV